MMSPIFSLIKDRISVEKICLFVIRWGIYLALFTPLVIHNKFFFPFVAPKTIFFRIVVEIILIAYIFLAAVNRKYLPKITPLFIGLTIFLEIFILTSLLGVNFERSFWSTFERMTGLFTILHLYALFIILTSCFKKREDWQKFLAVSALAGAVLSIYFLKGNSANTRMGATIGNSSFMGAYLLFDIFFAAILFFWHFLKKGLKAIFWQIFSGAALILMAYVLLNSSAHGALIFFGAGISIMALGYFLFSKQKKLKQIGAAVILILVIAGAAAAVFQPDFLGDKADDVFSRMRSRFTVWQISINSWQEKFILGWGPENFYIPFSKHFNPCLFLSECGGEIWFDRAHNIIFDTAVTMGLLGLVGYLALFLAAFWEIFRNLLKTAGRKEAVFPLGMAALLFAYFGQNLLVFDMINSYLVFFFSLAFIASFSAFSSHGAGLYEARLYEARPHTTCMRPGLIQLDSEDERRFKLNPILVIAVIAAMAPVLWFGNIQPALASHYTFKMLAAPNIKEAVDYFQKSLDTLMYKYEIREAFAIRLGQVAGKIEDKENLLKALQLAEKEMGKNVKESPLDSRQHLFLAKFYVAYYRVTGLKEILDLAENYAEKSSRLSPTSQQSYWLLGEIRLTKGDTDGAIKVLEKAVELEPRYAHSRWYLAMAYKNLGKYELAREELLKIGGMNLTFDDLMKAIEIFQALRDYQQLIPLYQRVLELRPDNIQIWGYLAASYYQLGWYDKAEEVALEVKERFPELAPQMEDYIKILSQ